MTWLSCSKDVNIDYENFYRCSNTANIPQSIKTFLVAGQSNAGNQGNFNDIPFGYFDGTCAWHYYSDEEGFGQLQSENFDRGGVEVSIGRELSLKYNEPIFIFKYFKGGTPLVPKDDLEDWSIRSGELYDAFLNNFSTMESHCTNCRFDIIGMAWIQGEKDASLSSTELDYFNELTDLMGGVRNNFGGELPISIVQLNLEHPAGNYNKIKIRNAQNNFVDNDGNAFLIDVDDIDYDPDNIPHYDMAGYLEIGRRIAENY